MVTTRTERSTWKAKHLTEGGARYRRNSLHRLAVESFGEGSKPATIAE